MSAGLLIAAPKSGSGKTTLTLGLLRAMRRRGLDVAGLKNGPDYIDPAFHAVATGKPSFNLDTWCMDEALIRSLLPASRLTLIEASMGLFDGVPAEQGRSGASADLAALLGVPVLLVVDVSGQGQSAAALVRGFMQHQAGVRLAGVILNKVASARHRLLTEGAVEKLGLPVLGCLPPEPTLSLPARHLGLVQAGEIDGLDNTLDRLADFVEAHCAIEAILALATPFTRGPFKLALPPPGQRIALAQDAAFSFIYPHLLHGWRRSGAEIIPFSPLQDEVPSKNADFCWLSGGYPELHAATLAQNVRFLGGLRAFAADRPVYGECGGYMVLGEGLIDASGARHAMAGLLPVSSSFAKRKMTLGYRRVTLCADHPLGKAGATFRGHEFHYSTLCDSRIEAPLALGHDAYGAAVQAFGARCGHVSGSYVHILAQDHA